MQCRTCYPFRSISITETSSLLRGSPLLCSTSVLSSSWVLHLDFSRIIGTTGSHVLYKSLRYDRATFMPGHRPGQAQARTYALRLPSDPSYRRRPCLRFLLLLVSITMKTSWFSYRGRPACAYTYAGRLRAGRSPHKLTPVPGVQKRMQQTSPSTSKLASVPAADLQTVRQRK
jgi:hypothetical protein